MSSLKPVQTEERRRSTRIDRGVALIVKGADVFKVPYQEFALTQAINSYGCRYQTRHEVAPGDVVQLDVVHTEEGHPGRSTQARVKWVSQPERGNRASYYEIAVELDAPGNVWGIANPPDDWSTTERPKPIDSTNAGNGGPTFDRGPSSPLPFAVDSENSPKDQDESPFAPRIDSPSLPQFMTQFLDGLSRHTQLKATDAAAFAVREEKDRWLADLRAELHAELPKIIERVVASAKSDLASEATQARQDQESAVRASYDAWTKTIHAEMDDLSACLGAQRSETVGQLEAMTTATIERAQRSLEESRRQELDDYISRFRSQLLPLIEQAQATTDTAKAAVEELKTGLLTASNAFQQFAKHEHDRVAREVQDTADRLRTEFADDLNSRIGQARSDVEQKTAASIEQAQETLQRLSQASQTDTRQHFESLLAAALDQLNALQEKTRDYASKTENSSRRQLQFVSELLSKFAAPDQAAPEDSAPPPPKP